MGVQRRWEIPERASEGILEELLATVAQANVAENWLKTMDCEIVREYNEDYGYTVCGNRRCTLSRATFEGGRDA